MVKSSTDQSDPREASEPASSEALRGRPATRPVFLRDDEQSGSRMLLGALERSRADAQPSAAPNVPLASLDFALLRGALEEIPFGVATTRSGEILYANAALERIYGAAPGGFEHKHVALLFEQETFLRISHLLDEKRVFDGRIRATGVDGRQVDAEVHAEWYSSEALGIGGFLVFRDVSLELGALGRLVDQLGGVLFRLRTADGSLEYVSPSVAKLTGIEPATCIEHPVLLTNLVSAEERERVLFLCKRVAAGEIASATAQVSLRRPDGRIRVLHIRATGRRDTAGVVRHIDGVVTDASREVEASGYVIEPPPSYTRPPPRRRDVNLAPSVMELSQELLREASQHLHSLGRAIGVAQLEIGAAVEALPQLGVVADRLDVMARSFAAATAINRRVRHALSGGGASAPLGDILEGVRATLAPVIGDGVITVEAGDAATMLLDHRVDELALALTHLALRVFRLAGSGGLRLGARRIAPLPPDPRLRSRIAAAPQETQDALITLLGIAPPDSAVHDDDVDSISVELQAVPRAENDQAFAAVKAILAAVGGTIEVDDVTFDEATTTIRLRG